MCVHAVHFKVCDVRPHIAHYFGNNERTDDNHLLSFGVGYYFVAQKWRILKKFAKKTNFWEIAWKVLGFKAMFKS
jgi:hypothetical protein